MRIKYRKYLLGLSLKNTHTKKKIHIHTQTSGNQICISIILASAFFHQIYFLSDHYGFHQNTLPKYLWFYIDCKLEYKKHINIYKYQNMYDVIWRYNFIMQEAQIIQINYSYIQQFFDYLFKSTRKVKGMLLSFYKQQWTQLTVFSLISSSCAQLKRH